jgi:epoxyqueuosine reductase
MLEDRLRKWAGKRGYRIALAETGVLEVARGKLEKRRDAGLIDAGFFKENLASFRFLDECRIAGPKSLVMVAVPSPVHVLPFVFGGKRIDGLIPPTYVNYRKTFEDILADMKANALAGEGGSIAIEILKAPLKSLAVHMGLASYGRNNITYVPGLGSGYQLCGYVVGTGKRRPSEDDRTKAGRAEKHSGRADKLRGDQGQRGSPYGDWPETVMDRCAKCRACVVACPTGAIREDRFLISAERCYTLLSESKKPMPEWARLPKSRCLIGCMNCQEVCPENKGRLRYEPSGVELTAEETEAVLELGRRLEAEEQGEDSGGGEKEEALAKFERLGMSEDLAVIGRNLRAILMAPGPGPAGGPRASRRP